MNPLQRAGDAVGRGWHKSKRGTTRTAAWVKDGVSGSFESLRDRAGGLRSGGEKPTEAEAAGGESSPGARERIGAAGLLERARGDRRIAIAWAAGGCLVVAWIAWTIYVWTSNGSTAGLGVLISWPALFAAAAIVAAPFVGATMLVRRHAAGEAPAIAGAGGAATETQAPEAEADSSDDEEESEGGDEESDGDAKSEDSEDADDPDEEAEDDADSGQDSKDEEPGDDA